MHNGHDDTLPTDPGAYDGHDELDEHMPLAHVLQARYQRTQAWRDRFRADATHYAANRPPEGTDPATWLALQRAAEAQADDLDHQLQAMIDQGLVPAEDA